MQIMKKYINGAEYDPQKEKEKCFDYVDLGLKSNVLWSTKNIGAQHIYDIGYKYAWGEITPCSGDSREWADYRFVSKKLAPLADFIRGVEERNQPSYDPISLLNQHGKENRERSIRFEAEVSRVECATKCLEKYTTNPVVHIIICDKNDARLKYYPSIAKDTYHLEHVFFDDDKFTHYPKRNIFSYRSFERLVMGDNKLKLEPEDDIATVKLGGCWKMPTKEDFEDLIKNCNWDWKTIEGVQGALVTGPNGKSIFLPTNKNSVSCWSSSLGFHDSRAYYLFANEQKVEIDQHSRIKAFNIRPVFKRQ